MKYSNTFSTNVVDDKHMRIFTGSGSHARLRKASTLAQHCIGNLQFGMRDVRNLEPRQRFRLPPERGRRLRPRRSLLTDVLSVRVRLSMCLSAIKLKNYKIPKNLSVTKIFDQETNGHTGRVLNSMLNTMINSFCK